MIGLRSQKKNVCSFLEVIIYKRIAMKVVAKIPEKYNTLLHLDSEKNIEKSESLKNSKATSSHSACFQTAIRYKINKNVLLSSAIAQVNDLKGNYHRCRVY